MSQEKERLARKIRAQRQLAVMDNGREVKAPFYPYVPEYDDVFHDYYLKYILLKGGRGSCKTINACCFLIDESFDYSLKGCLFLFGREIQKGVDESVFAVVKSMIHQAFLLPYFSISKTRIVNKLTGITFIFTGLRATGGKTSFSQVNKIKGKFNVKYLFIDESQDLSADTINALFPTVNRSSVINIIPKDWHTIADKSDDELIDRDTRFIFAMNPNFDTDPIVEKLEGFQHSAMIAGTRSNTAIIHKNIFDLPPEFQDQQLLEEAEAEKGSVYYDHVWKGMPSHKISGYPFTELKKITMDGGSVRILGAFLDPSFKGRDFTALSFVGEVSGRMICWGRVWKRAWNNVVNEVVFELKKTPPDYFWYEDNSMGTVPQDKFAESGVNAIPCVTLGNKENRIYQSASYTADRMSIVVNLCNSEYVNQVLKYNEHAEYDDGPDSLALCLIKCGVIRERVKF